MKGELSENDLKYKAEAYCSSMERCVADVEAKLSQWGSHSGNDGENRSAFAG